MCTHFAFYTCFNSDNIESHYLIFSLYLKQGYSYQIEFWGVWDKIKQTKTQLQLFVPGTIKGCHFDHQYKMLLSTVIIFQYIYFDMNSPVWARGLDSHVKKI